jgi:hypothetical protein
MNSPRIHTVFYFDFMNALRKATNDGQRIIKTEKQKWSDYVRKNKVPEAAMTKIAESMQVGGKFEPVIINDGGKWEGYYVYSKDDQFSIKFEIQEE